MVLMQQKCSMFLFFSIFLVSTTFTAQLSEVRNDPFIDADVYLKERSEALSNIDSKITEYQKETLDQAQEEKVQSLKDSRETLKDWLDKYEKSYTDYKKANDQLASKIITESDAQQQLASAQEAGGYARSQIDPVENEINQLEADIDTGIKEVPVSKPADEKATEPSEERKKVEEAEGQEDPVIASLIEGIIEYFQITLFAQWYGQLYLSIPEIGWQIFALIFGEPSIDWSPLEYIPPEGQQEIAHAPTEKQQQIFVSKALQAFKALQGYKVQFIDEAQTRKMQQILTGGNQLNTILYTIEAGDTINVLKYLDYLARQIPIESDTFISKIVNILKKQTIFSWLTLSPTTLTVPVIAKPDDQISVSDFMQLLRTLQRLESGFIAWLVDVMKTKRPLEQQEKDSILQLANAINSLELKIQNEDAGVFADLKKIETVMSDQITMLADQFKQNPQLLSNLNALNARLRQYSQQPIKS